jgi:hypothetical protein
MKCLLREATNWREHKVRNLMEAGEALSGVCPKVDWIDTL